MKFNNVLFLALVCVFLFHACRYLFLAVVDDGESTEGEEEGEFLDSWENFFFSSSKSRALILPSSSHCPIGHQLFPVPRGYHIYTPTGGKLDEGANYCVRKQPPHRCNPRWAYLHYSLESNLWECHSKVPGIYNAVTDEFDACREGRLVDNDSGKAADYTRLSPSDFIERPTRFSCQCPDEGFLSLPDISRSTCFPDPCLSHLPLGSSGVYRKEDGSCECGAMFWNIDDNPYAPCTACPDHPRLDREKGRLTLWIKCGSPYDCHAPEDIKRGCMAVTFSARASTKTDDFRIIGVHER